MKKELKLNEEKEEEIFDRYLSSEFNIDVLEKEFGLPPKIICKVVEKKFKTINTNQFFEFAEKRWHYTGHKKHPKIIDEVNELAKSGVKVQIAAIAICDKYSCPLGINEIRNQFRLDLFEIADVKKKLGIPRKDYAKMVAKVLVDRGFVNDYDNVLNRIKELIEIDNYKVKPMTAAVRAGYDYLSEIGGRMSIFEYSKMFRVSESTLYNIKYRK